MRPFTLLEKLDGLFLCFLAVLSSCNCGSKDGEHRRTYVVRYKNGDSTIPVTVVLDYKKQAEYVINMNTRTPTKSVTFYDFKQLTKSNSFEKNKSEPVIHRHVHFLLRIDGEFVGVFSAVNKEELLRLGIPAACDRGKYYTVAKLSSTISKSIAYKDMQNKECFIGKLTNETLHTENEVLKGLKNPVESQPVTLNLDVTRPSLTPTEVRNIAGQKIAMFCRKMGTWLLQNPETLKRSRRQVEHQVERTYSHHGQEKKEYSSYGYETYKVSYPQTSQIQPKAIRPQTSRHGSLPQTLAAGRATGPNRRPYSYDHSNRRVRANQQNFEGARTHRRVEQGHPAVTGRHGTAYHRVARTRHQHLTGNSRAIPQQTLNDFPRGVAHVNNFLLPQPHLQTQRNAFVAGVDRANAQASLSPQKRLPFGLPPGIPNPRLYSNVTRQQRTSLPTPLASEAVVRSYEPQTMHNTGKGWIPPNGRILKPEVHYPPSVLSEAVNDTGFSTWPPSAFTDLYELHERRVKPYSRHGDLTSSSVTLPNSSAGISSSVEEVAGESKPTGLHSESRRHNSSHFSEGREVENGRQYRNETLYEKAIDSDVMVIPKYAHAEFDPDATVVNERLVASLSGIRVNVSNGTAPAPKPPSSYPRQFSNHRADIPSEDAEYPSVASNESRYDRNASKTNDLPVTNGRERPIAKKGRVQNVLQLFTPDEIVIDVGKIPRKPELPQTFPHQPVTPNGTFLKSGRRTWNNGRNEQASGSTWHRTFDTQPQFNAYQPLPFHKNRVIHHRKRLPPQPIQPPPSLAHQPAAAFPPGVSIYPRHPDAPFAGFGPSPRRSMVSTNGHQLHRQRHLRKKQRTSLSCCTPGDTAYQHCCNNRKNLCCSPQRQQRSRPRSCCASGRSSKTTRHRPDGPQDHTQPASAQTTQNLTPEQICDMKKMCRTLYRSTKAVKVCKHPNMPGC